MNKLQYETSPYLLQHAGNPVDWYPWKQEAFDRAVKEDKPILVSIGYSTCHWCHVMEKESFEDQEVADFMNEHFICIKVDREERPDVDQIYMEACQVLTGSGGWPLNCFLTPDKQPFYCGTYFPPMPAYNRPSWLQVLMNISHAYQNKRERVVDQATRLMEIIRNSGSNFTGNKMTVVCDKGFFNESFLDKVYRNIEKNFDRKEGGFGGAPKFPATMQLHYLLNYYYYRGKEEALNQVLLSLDKMIMGGIYDQLGGGFSRYATDAAWLIPHFEKMLYDNALLVRLLAEAYKVTKKEMYREAITETLDWVAREMTHPDGGFYSAQDADSEGVEGKYYVWSKSEIDAILKEEAPLFNEFYGVSEGGNWEGENILWRQWTFEEFAKKKGMDPDDLKAGLAASRQRLFDKRDTRVHPGMDDKVLLDWNALMVAAYARAYAALGCIQYKEAAVRGLKFIMDHMQQPGGIKMYHTFKEGKVQYDAFLDDYAYLIEAFIEVYEITFETEYLLQCERYMDYLLDHFLDQADKIFYFTSAEQTDIPLRRKDLYDSATPSGNSTMVRNLQRLGILLGNDHYRQLAGAMLLSMKESIGKYPGSFGRWATGVMNEVYHIPEIAVIGAEAFEKAEAINKEFLPQKTLMASRDGKENFPLLNNKTSNGDTYIYVCRDFTCQRPVKTIEDFRQLVKGNLS